VYGAKRWKAGTGVDFNGNGRLEKKEKISTYNTNRIPGNDKRVIGDWTDWLAFYRANSKVIHTKVGSNQKSIFFWAGKFKTTNPLHIITSIESPLVKQSQVLTAYKKTWKIIARARKIPIKGSSRLRLAKAKLLAMRTAMVKSGITLKNFYYKKPLFIGNMVDGVLDCNTSSYVILAEAHEKRWPLFGVQAPQHFFLRWHDKSSRVRFNMDTVAKERFPTDLKYKKILNIHPRAVSAGVYLRNLTPTTFIADVYQNRSLALAQSGKYREGIRDFTITIGLNKKSEIAYYNRGVVYTKLGELSKALKDFTEAVRLNPGNTVAHFNRGIIYGRTGKHAEAVKAYKKAITANPKYVPAHFNSGIMYAKLNMYAHAIKSYAVVTKLKPKFYRSYVNRGLVYVQTKKYVAAIRDFRKALSLLQKSDPKYTPVRDFLEGVYMTRGVARFRAKKYAGALRDFRMLLKINPKHTTAHSLIKRSTYCKNNPRKCKP